MQCSFSLSTGSGIKCIDLKWCAQDVSSGKKTWTFVRPAGWLFWGLRALVVPPFCRCAAVRGRLVCVFLGCFGNVAFVAEKFVVCVLRRFKHGGFAVWSLHLARRQKVCRWFAEIVAGLGRTPAADTWQRASCGRFASHLAGFAGREEMGCVDNPWLWGSIESIGLISP